MTASGAPVAAGSTNVTLGANGALNVALVPNAGATPAGVCYTVVYQLGAGEVKTEYWVVPTTSPADLAQVRTTPGSGAAAAPASMQYVNSELATKANDNAVVTDSAADDARASGAGANCTDIFLPYEPAPRLTAPGHTYANALIACAYRFSQCISFKCASTPYP